MVSSPRLQWPADAAGWPHRAASRIEHCHGQRWLVQQMGRGPALLLIHGTGASTHSWRAVLPLLAQHFEVLAVDLPGHGFSGLPATPQGLSMEGMARALAALLQQLRVQPALLVGHSAGAAIAVRMALDGLSAPAAIVSLNGALLPLQGLVAPFFLPIARVMAALPLVPRFFAWRAADRAVLQRLMDGTGSRVDAEGMGLYARLVANPGHVQGALGMMANWDLHTLRRDLPRLAVPLSLVVGSHDGTVPPQQAQQTLALLRSSPDSTLTTWPGLGHLAHEEEPARAAEHVLAVARSRGLVSGAAAAPSSA
jgi:magnesium chelatase accessory protein